MLGSFSLFAAAVRATPPVPSPLARAASPANPTAAAAQIATIVIGANRAIFRPVRQAIRPP
jgi:hypothetical protein